MDDIAIEYCDRILAEQMAMTEALQFIAKLLIYFAFLVAFVILIVNIISGVVRARHSERRSSGHRQPQPPEIATYKPFAK